jgi:organic radical activating enzyme
MADSKELVNFRDTVLNSKSKSFCGAKWGNSTLWLNSGETASCHLPPVHKIDPVQILEDPAKLHTTDHKIKMRDLMKTGEKPSECDYCWKVESMGDEYLSDRVFKSLQFTPEEMQKWYDAPADARIVPPTIEVMFDRTCNFACSYCNANFSTEWAKDIKKNGHYKGNTRGMGAYKHDGSENNSFEKESNPYIKAWWEWWPELAKELRVLRITGGEPLMSNDVWKLFDRVIEEKREFEVGINSNLGAKPALIDKLIEKSHGMKNLTIFTSMEAVGDQAEYIRDKLDYQHWINNVERILEESNVRRIVVMMTINALCIFTVTDFLKQMLEWKKKYPRKSLGISVNFLRFPAFMSVTVLPDDLRDMVHAELEEWYEENKNSPYLNSMEKGDIERLISYVKVIETPHSYDNDIEENRKDFKKFYEQYDVRRNKSIKIFPKEFLNWYNTL